MTDGVAMIKRASPKFSISPFIIFPIKYCDCRVHLIYIYIYIRRVLYILNIHTLRDVSYTLTHFSDSRRYTYIATNGAEFDVYALVLQVQSAMTDLRVPESLHLTRSINFKV